MPEVAKTDEAARKTDVERRALPRGKDATSRTLPLAGASAQASPDPEALLMMQAMQARSSGDVARAARLLGEYRAKFPNGELQEEALALSIEAEAARGNPAATDLARTYLSKFPAGRFRARVERALRTTGR
jgi:outer membrane translocation and assembly module TamA